MPSGVERPDEAPDIVPKFPFARPQTLSEVRTVGRSALLSCAAVRTLGCFGERPMRNGRLAAA